MINYEICANSSRFWMWQGLTPRKAISPLNVIGVHRYICYCAHCEGVWESILNLGTRWKCVVKLRCGHFTPGERSLVPIGSWRGPRASVGTSWNITIPYFFYIHVSVHHYSVLIWSNEMQQYAGIYLLHVYSTCFGRPSRPSSGVQKNVTAASGTGHIT